MNGKIDCGVDSLINLLLKYKTNSSLTGKQWSQCGSIIERRHEKKDDNS